MTAELTADEAQETPRSKRRTSSTTKVHIRTSWGVAVLSVVLVCAPMYLGGAPAPAVPLWTTLALLALFFTGIDVKAVRQDKLLWAALLLIAVAAFQLVPLPPLLLRALSPRSAELSGHALDALNASRLDAWRCLHMDPGNGYADLHYMVGLTAGYLAARQASSRGYGPALLTAGAISAMWIALLTLAHAVWKLDRVYGFYMPTQASPRMLSPVLNPNHLAALTGVGAVLWAGHIADALRGIQRVTYAALSFVCALVCVLTLSRGGIAALCAGFLLLVVLNFVKAKRGSRSKRRMSVESLALAATFVLGLAIYGSWEAVSTEYATGDTGKLRMFGQVLRASLQYWLVGMGSGGLHAAMYRGEFPPEYTVERSESLLLDLGAAFGWPAALAAALFASMWLWEHRPTSRSFTGVLAFTALVMFVLHDMADFSMWLGGCGFIAVACAGALAGHNKSNVLISQAPRTHRLAPLLLAAVSGLAAVATARTPLSYERPVLHDAYLRATSAADVNALEPRLRAAMLRHPGDPYLPLLAGATTLAQHGRGGLRLINRALTIAPTWDVPHVVLAQAFADSGRRTQALLETRLAAEHSTLRHAQTAAIVLRTATNGDELRAAVPAGPVGTRFLRVLAETGARGPLGGDLDAILLERVPSDLGALLRSADRARAAHDGPREVSLLERAIRANPAAPDGYLRLATVHAEAGDVAAAEALVRRGLQQTSQAQRLLQRLAEIQSARGDAEAMRATIQQALEQVGSQIDARSELFGTLGVLEAQMHHEANALSAYERAEALAYPQHPFLTRIIELANRMGDQGRLRAACGTLIDQGVEHTESVRALCLTAMH